MVAAPVTTIGVLQPGYLPSVTPVAVSGGHAGAAMGVMTSRLASHMTGQMALMAPPPATRPRGGSLFNLLIRGPM